MDAHIQYDPRTKQQLKDLLYSYLYLPVEKASKAKLSKLILRNSSLMGNSKKAFTYKGAVYSLDDNQSYRNTNRLHKLLYPDMDEHLKEVTILNTTELPFVVGFITSVLNSSNSIQDYLNLLPASIHSPIEQLAATCPCRLCNLSPELVHSMQVKNKEPIELIKRRMVLNLLI
jgi:hypothetical protein